MKEVWIMWSTDLFQRIVIRNWWVYRQAYFMDIETGKCSWRDFPFFRKRKRGKK